MSTRTCNFNIQWLPGIMTGSHIVSGLTHLSLISTRKNCNAGCKVMFDEDGCRVYYKGKLVLWQLPINPTAIHNARTSLSPLDLEIPVDMLKVGMQSIHQASNVHTIPYKQNQLKYMHQSMFSQPVAILKNAINNKFLSGFHLMENKCVQKDLSKSPATSKRRIKRPYYPDHPCIVSFLIRLILTLNSDDYAPHVRKGRLHHCQG